MGTARAPGGRTGFGACLELIQFVFAHSLSLDVFFFPLFLPDLCFSSTVSIGLEMAFHFKKALWPVYTGIRLDAL